MVRAYHGAYILHCMFTPYSITGWLHLLVEYFVFYLCDESVTCIICAEFRRFHAKHHNLDENKKDIIIKYTLAIRLFWGVSYFYKPSLCSAKLETNSSELWIQIIISLFHQKVNARTISYIIIGPFKLIRIILMNHNTSQIHFWKRNKNLQNFRW